MFSTTPRAKFNPLFQTGTGPNTRLLNNQATCHKTL